MQGAVSFALLLLSGQVEAPTFHTGTALVRVPVEVRVDGRAVPGLTREDFVLREGSEARPVVAVGDEKQPLDLLILLDISGSMEPHIRALGTYADAAISQLSPGDRVGIRSFHAWSEWVLRPADNHTRVKQRLREYSTRMRAGGATFTSDALHEAAKYMRRHGRKDARRAVLVVTDNEGQGYLYEEKEVTESLRKSDTSVNALLVNEDFEGRHLRNVDLRPMAAATGGYVARAQQAGRAFADMVERLRHSYSVYFNPTPGLPGAKRNATVELSDGARARLRHAVVSGRREFALD